MKMRIRNKNFEIQQLIALFFYYSLFRYFPTSCCIIHPIGSFSKWTRYQCCKKIFLSCGKNVNIERKAYFASGVNLVIGDNSGIGINSYIPGDTVIGRNVMMGPNCYILSNNHSFNCIDIPMIEQGHTKCEKTIIEDDVWIGRNVTFTPGRTVRKGSIVAACCVLTKDFPEYSIVGGNPSRLLKYRK